ncbi:MAG: aminomethyltransferase, partial [Actinomycetota bacterium]|nr:aminomethyltransferase [Actinomycetota bacterium]
MTDLRRSPLHEQHLSLGAKMADFGGWEMPIDYAGGGVMKEHAAVRESVGIFDVSHLGKATVRGAGAVEFVNTAFSNDLDRIGPGQAQYTLCCDDDIGGVVDDLIAYVIGADDVFLVPNAANTAEVVRRLAAAAPSGVEVSDQHEAYGVLAVQGSASDAVLQSAGLPTGHEYMSFVEAQWRGAPVIVCRTGYTGERGYELLPPWDRTAELWQALLDEGEPQGLRPCGGGAR